MLIHSGTWVLPQVVYAVHNLNLHGEDVRGLWREIVTALDDAVKQQQESGAELYHAVHATLAAGYYSPVAGPLLEEMKSYEELLPEFLRDAYTTWTDNLDSLVESLTDVTAGLQEHAGWLRDEALGQWVRWVDGRWMPQSELQALTHQTAAPVEDPNVVAAQAAQAEQPKAEAQPRLDKGQAERLLAELEATLNDIMAWRK